MMKPEIVSLLSRCWNQKFLDYEIETQVVRQVIHLTGKQLESKVSRLRD